MCSKGFLGMRVSHVWVGTRTMAVSVLVHVLVVLALVLVLVWSRDATTVDVSATSVDVVAVVC